MLHGILEHRWSHRPPNGPFWLRRMALVGCTTIYLLPGLLLAIPARAERIPGFGSMPMFRFSRDPTPMRIVFTHPEATTGSFPALVIPRAYVFYALDPPDVSAPLGPVVEVTQVGLNFMDGSGEPYSTAFVAYRGKHGLGEDRAAADLRPQVYDVRLSATTNPDQGRDLRAGRDFAWGARDDFEGLKGIRGLGTATYYIGADTDEFWTAKCYNPANPVFLCSFDFLITPGISAVITFSDFRVRGGRAEANRRLRFAREVVCRYLERC